MTDTQEQTELNDIVRKIHNSDVFPFFQEQFDKFCKMVENYGTHVENCSKNPDLYVDLKKEKQIEKKREGLVKKYQEYINQNIDIDNQINKENQAIISAIQQIEDKKDVTKNKALIASSEKKIQALEKSKEPIRQSQAKYKKKLEALPTGDEPPKEGWIEYVYSDFEYILLPFLHPEQKRNKSHGRFWITPEYINPTIWFNQIMNFALLPTVQLIPKEADKLICNAVILADAHDESREVDGTNNSVYRNQKYQGKYFKCNKFCRDLWEKLQARPNRIKDAYTDVKPYLDEWLEKNKPPGNGGKDIPAMLPEKQIKILKYLNEIKTAVAQVDIESGTTLSKNTVSNELKILKGYNFAAPPKGKKRRIAITKKGIDYLKSLK